MAVMQTSWLKFVWSTTVKIRMSNGLLAILYCHDKKSHLLFCPQHSAVWIIERLQNKRSWAKFGNIFFKAGNHMVLCNQSIKKNKYCQG